jgi:hypothetical protein
MPTQTEGWPPPNLHDLCGNSSNFARVPADVAYATRTVEALTEDCQVMLFAASQGMWSKAHTQSYDAARKSVEQLLLAQGWRVTAGGGGAHAAVADVVHAWLSPRPPPGPRIAHKYAAARTARHQDEYPRPGDKHYTDNELRELALDNIRLMNLARQALGIQPRTDLVPTEDNIALWRSTQ